MTVASDDLAKGDARPQPGTGPKVRAKQQGARRGWLRLILMFVVPLVLIAVAGYYYLSGARYVSTDDSYVQADKVTISADVAGRVATIEVHDNEPVKAGQILFRLDDRSFQIAVERAKAQLAAARLQVDATRASYHQRQADVKAAQDTLAYQQREFERQQQLFASHITPQSKLDEVRHNLDNARQQLAAIQQQEANVVANLNGDPDLPVEKQPMVMQAQAQLDQAELDLSHTVIYAPGDGIVSKVDSLQVGNYLNIATPAFSLVASDRPWVEANFKETDLTHMKAGQQATIDVDTYSDHTCTGKVDSIGAATGSEFSVLPPQNATGNWVKVVQRLPVRMLVDCGPGRPLRSGMSATVEVDTQFEHPWIVWLHNLRKTQTAAAQ
jgi:membrane fusion protein (multidrug efflux system)